MDRKAIIILAVSFALMIGWSLLVNRIYPPQPIPLETNRLASATNQTTANTNLSAGAAPSSGVSTPPELPAQCHCSHGQSHSACASIACAGTADWHRVAAGCGR